MTLKLCRWQEASTVGNFQNLKYICNLQLLKYKSQCLSGTIC